MRRCSFSDTWRRWVFACISSVRFLVLVNGSPTGFFSSSRGLRQGDPLSPLFFLLVMEALSRLLERVTEGGFITGYSVGNSDSHALSISHLLFADDTLIMCGATPDQLWHLRGVFIWFQAVSGLKINMGKSELVPIGQVPNVVELANILGVEFQLYHFLIWVFRLVLLIKIRLFGIKFWNALRKDWQVGNNCIFPKGAASH